MSKQQRRFDELDAFVLPMGKYKKYSLQYRCQQFLRKAAKTSCLVLIVYFFSISLMFYNHKSFHVFKNPLSITMIHLIVKFVMAGCVRSILSFHSGKERTMLSWSTYITKLTLPGAAGSLDIGLSNWGLELLTISLYSMTRSTSIIFIFGFAICFKLERLSYVQIIVVGCIALGLALFTFDLTKFNTVGFVLVLTASFLSGLRWTLAQMIMQKDDIGLNHPLDMMYHIQPLMMFALLPLAVYFEGIHFTISKHTFDCTSFNVLLKTIAIFLVGGMLGFMLEMSEFLLLRHTSGLTLTVAAIFRKLCVLLLAVLVNGDKMNGINILGLIICLGGILLHVTYNAAKPNENREEKEMCAEREAMLQEGDAMQGDSDERENHDDIFINDVIFQEEDTYDETVIYDVMLKDDVVTLEDSQVKYDEVWLETGNTYNVGSRSIT